jgi:CPA2 family monovalent cation:H+ antiporter-2
MLELIFFKDFALVLLAALAGGLLAHALRQPLILGYIIGGLVISPFTTPPSSPDGQALDLLAQVGVILLMFGLGLEFSLKELLSVRREALIGGPLGIALLIGITIGLGTLLGWSLDQSLVAGAIVSVVSTMVLVKLLMQRGELSTEHGRIMVGISIVEDLAVVVLMLLLSAVGQAQQGHVFELFMALGRALVILIAVVWLARRAVPAVMGIVARTKSAELFLLVALGISLGTAVFTASLGLSLAMGAFLAGLIISESPFVHETLARILPLRDSFVALFFVSMGTLIDPQLLVENWTLLAFFLFLIIPIKGTVRAGLTLLTGRPWRVALLVGVSFTQIGEFSFVIAKLGLDERLISTELYNATLAASLVTILLNSLWVQITARSLRTLAPSRATDTLVTEDNLKNHVILCGYGRMGSLIGAALENFNMPYVVIDLDSKTVKHLKERGVPSTYGDAGNERVCQSADPARAALAVLVLPDSESARRAFRALKTLNPALPIITRAHWDSDREALFREGATEVIQPEFEGGNQMIRHVFVHLGIPAASLEAYLHQLHEQRYGRVLQGWLEREATLDKLQKMQEVEIQANSALVNLSLKDAKMRERMGVSVLSVKKRDGSVIANPPPEIVLTAGDRLVVIGLASQLLEFLEWTRAEPKD